MKQKLLLAICCSFCLATFSQENKARTTAYAITGSEKGSRQWMEVRLVDVATGEEIKKIYSNKQEVQLLNARTRKALTRKDFPDYVAPEKIDHLSMNGANRKASNIAFAPNGNAVKDPRAESRILIATEKMEKIQNHTKVQCTTSPVRLATAPQHPVMIDDVDGHMARERRIRMKESGQGYDSPFATYSAALAYDKKHDRLYYTPMGINQLRYIDLKSGKPTIYYFEDEKFGALSHRSDVSNQVTRMVIASDGNGYALTNNARHLYKFTTGRKPTITDLGSLTDDASNGNYSVHHSSGYGGDMIADGAGSLYLITANRRIFQLDPQTRVAKYKGSISGLPSGFTTNGAMVENGSSIIVCSSNSTSGYYRFDMNNLVAEKISTGVVFNASDLASGNLVKVDKKKKKEQLEGIKKPLAEEEKELLVAGDEPDKSIPVAKKKEPVSLQDEITERPSINIYPNPVTNRTMKFGFTNQPEGRYKLQLFDIAGKMIHSEEVDISSKNQVHQVLLPQHVSQGTYLVNVTDRANQVVVSRRLFIEK